MVTTNCLTGRGEYLTETHDRQRACALARATSSLPYVSKITMIDGQPMLDGGIVDSIPIGRAQATGHKHNIVITTRNYGYRESGHDRKQPMFIYRHYPRLRVALSHRIEAYNEQLQMVEDLERKRKITVIRPQKPMEVHRMEKDIAKLERLYEEGFKLGEEFYQANEIAE